MTNSKKSSQQRFSKGMRFWQRSPLVLLLLLMAWSLTTGWGLAQAIQPSQSGFTIAQLTPVTPTIDPWNPPPPRKPSASPVAETRPGIPGVDPVPPKYRLGQELYLENCGTCHLAIPPEVMPSETWRRLLQDPDHYGEDLNLPVGPARFLIWNYLSAYSRELIPDEEVPYRVDKSRYFAALHPKLKLPKPVRTSSCISCHPAAQQFNFRTLTAEWQKKES